MKPSSDEEQEKANTFRECVEDPIREGLRRNNRLSFEDRVKLWLEDYICVKQLVTKPTSLNSEPDGTCSFSTDTEHWSSECKQHL
jgi:hypothetical protein